MCYYVALKIWRHPTSEAKPTAMNFSHQDLNHSEVSLPLGIYRFGTGLRTTRKQLHTEFKSPARNTRPGLRTCCLTPSTSLKLEPATVPGVDLRVTWSRPSPEKPVSIITWFLRPSKFTNWFKWDPDCRHIWKECSIQLLISFWFSMPHPSECHRMSVSIPRYCQKRRTEKHALTHFLFYFPVPLEKPSFKLQTIRNQLIYSLLLSI